METSLANKNSAIVIVDESGTLRPVASGILRDLGYKNIFSLKTLQEFINYNDRSNVSWLMTHPYMDQSFNGFDLLKKCLEDEDLHNLQVTLLLDESEKELIPFALSLGALSCHVGAITGESIRKETKRIAESIRKGLSTTEIAANFLRHDLKSQNYLKEWLSLEQSLLESCEPTAQQMLNTADALLATGDEQAGTTQLFESILFEPELKPQAEALIQKHQGKSLSDLSSPIKRKTCLLVDSDQSARNAANEIIEKLNFEKILEFDDGKSALEHARKHLDIDLIIMEWKIRGMTGPVLLQRFREDLKISAPIVVVSSLLKEKDEILLKEVGVNKVIIKPIQHRNFVSTMITVLKESQYPSDLEAKEREFRLKINSQKISEAESILSWLLADSKVPKGKKALLLGELYLAQGHYEDAEAQGQAASRMLGETTFVLNLLGKASLHMHQHQKALQYLQKASALSPDNLERLCTIAKEQAAIGNTDDAKDTMKEVISQAPDAGFTKEAQLSIAVKDGDLEEAEITLGSTESSDSLVSFWNNQAVSNIKQGQYTEGINIYRQALRSLPPGFSTTRSFIRYNLALGLARNNELKKAAIYLELESNMPKSGVSAKAGSLLSKIRHSIKTGEALALQSSAPPVMTRARRTYVNIFDGINTKLSAGDRCLWGIYQPELDLPEELAHTLSQGAGDEEEAAKGAS